MSCTCAVCTTDQNAVSDQMKKAADQLKLLTFTSYALLLLRSLRDRMSFQNALHSAHCTTQTKIKLIRKKVFLLHRQKHETEMNIPM